MDANRAEAMEAFGITSAPRCGDLGCCFGIHCRQKQINRLRAEVEALREENAKLCGYDSYAEQLFQEGLRRKTDEAIDAAIAKGAGNGRN